MRFNPKPKNRWKWLLITAVPLVIFAVAAKMTNTTPPTHSAQTAPDEAPELKTRVYSRAPAEIMELARMVAGRQKTWFKSWRVAQSGADTLEIEVPVLIFTDDLTIRVDESDGQTRVNVASKSRVGQGDFGENRRHVAQFLRALDEEIGDGNV